MTYELTINKDGENRPFVEEERLRQRRQGKARGARHLSAGQHLSDVGMSGGRDLLRRQRAHEKGLPDLYRARQVQARVGGEHRTAYAPGCECIAELSIFPERNSKADCAPG